jgi:simple sugar transport system substrate-binding protein
MLNLRFITHCVDEDFFDTVKKGTDDAAKLLGVQYDFIGTEDVDFDEQIEMIRQAIRDKVDGIATSTLHPTAYNAVLEEVQQAKIPVVLLNTAASQGKNNDIPFIGQDVYNAGRKIGANIANKIPNGAKILVPIHSEGISALDERARGIRDGLANKNLNFESVVTGIEVEDGFRVVSEKLKTDPEIKIVLCTGQADTEGAGKAVQANFPNQGYVVAGFDVSPGILRLIKNDIISFTLDQQPYAQGFYPVIQLIQQIRYGIIPSDMDSGSTLISKGNVNEVLKLTEEGYR